MIDFGTVRPGSVLYVPFHTFDSNDPSASVTITGLLASDVEIYKDGSVTQRASDTGYALLDTDGIDFDGITGIHGISIDLASNATAGFFAAGAQYWVVVSAITVDAATINFIAATFRIGYPDAILNTTIATLATQTSFTLTAGPAEDDALNGCVVCIHDVASAVQLGFAVVSDYTGSTKTVTLTAGGSFTAAATDNISIFPPVNAAWGGGVAYTATRGLAGTALPAAAADAAGGLIISDAGGLDADAQRTDVAAILVDTGTTLDDLIDTEVATIISVLGTPAGASLAADIAAIEAQTDDIGAAGAGLTAVPWNASWDAEVQSEVDDALKALGLHHLVLQTTTIATLASQTSFTLTAGSADDNAYNGMIAVVTDVSTATQKAIGVISDYTGATKTVTLREDPAIFTMAATDLITIIAISPDTLAILADTNELQGDWVDGGRLDLILDIIAADTTTDIPALIGTPVTSLAAMLQIIDDFLDTEIAAILVDTGTTLDDFLDTEIADILADTNELQTDWVDGGRLDLLIDAIKAVTDLLNAAQSEPTGVPAANATPLVKLGILYMMARNQVDVTATKKTFYGDDAVAEFEKDLSDDGTVYSEGEVNAI